MRQVIISNQVKQTIINLLPKHRKALIKGKKELGYTTISDVIRHLINEYLIKKSK